MNFLWDAPPALRDAALSRYRVRGKFGPGFKLVDLRIESSVEGPVDSNTLLPPFTTIFMHNLSYTLGSPISRFLILSIT